MKIQLVSDRLTLLKCYLENFPDTSWWPNSLTPFCMFLLGLFFFACYSRMMSSFLQFSGSYCGLCHPRPGGLKLVPCLPAPLPHALSFALSAGAHFLSSTFLTMRSLSPPIQIALRLALLPASAVSPPLLTELFSLPDNPPHLHSSENHTHLVSQGTSVY